jgi:chromatin remodeling complex protein RSC6
VKGEGETRGRYRELYKIFALPFFEKFKSEQDQRKMTEEKEGEKEEEEKKRTGRERKRGSKRGIERGSKVYPNILSRSLGAASEQ